MGQCDGGVYLVESVTDVATLQVRDPARLRPSDVPVLIGDNSKFVKATGWAPTIPFEQTLRDMLEYWRAR